MGKEKLTETKRKIDELSALLGKALDGNITQAQAAREMGITPQQFNNMQENAFAPYIRKNRILTEDGIVSIMDELETPCEKLTKDILGIRQYDKLYIIEAETEDRFLEAMKDTLTEKEYMAIVLRYGFSDGGQKKHPMAYAEIAKKMGCSENSVMVILNKALRKLRSPSVFRRLLPNYGKYACAMSELEELKPYADKLEEKYEETMCKVRLLRYQSDVCGYLEGLKEKGSVKEMLLKDIPGMQEDFLLAMEGINVRTVADLLSASQEEIEAATLSHGISLEDYICTGCGYGMFPAPLWRGELDEPIENMGLSTRSYNVLHRRLGSPQIKTVGDVAAMTKRDLKKIRNLGSGCLKEICTVMKEKYGVVIKE